MLLRSITGAVALALLAAVPAAAQLPAVAVEATTVALPNFGSHRGMTVTSTCAGATKLVGGGSYLRNATNPATLPTNGLVLGGTLASTGATPVDEAPADGALDLSNWMTIANYTGQSEAGNQATTFALCATAGGPSETVVSARSTVGANATQEVNPPNVTTATCPQGSRLIGGGARTRGVGQVSDGTTVGNTGNLKPLGNYPSDAAGVPAADGTTDATSWSAYGSAGIAAAADEVLAFALCSKDPATPPVRVTRIDYAGPVAQPGTTTIEAPVTCADGTRLIGGGYKVDETVGATTGLQPQQGYHMRGSYPTADATGTTEASDGATNLTTWKSLVQAGGQTLAAGRQMHLRGFAMCMTAPVVLPDLRLAVSAAPSPVVVGEPLTYTYALTNPGGDAAGVVLEDTLAAGLTFVSADHAECAVAAGKLTCALGSIAAGASLAVKVVVVPTSTGTVTNAAKATLDGSDGTPADNEASTTVEVRAVPRARTSVTATAPAGGVTGEPLTARATLAGGADPGGTITFAVYGAADLQCANPLATSTAAVDGNGSYVSARFVATEAGAYRWTASYGGDGGNESSASACGEALTLVKATPALTLAVSGAGATATLTGGSALSGAITFRVYADALCAAPLATFDVAVAGTGNYDAPAFAAPGPGTYRWTAAYGGDERNAAAGPTDCAGALVTVAPAPQPPSPPPVIADTPRKPSNAFRIRSSRTSRSGVVTLKLDAPGAGRFVASARGFGRVSVVKKAKGALTLTLRPTAAGRRALRRNARMRVSVSVRFTPAGGEARTRAVTVTLKRP